MNAKNVISGILRLVSGLALIIFSVATYYRIREHVAAGGPMELAGITIGASPGQIRFALGVIVLLGALLTTLGVLTLVKRRS